MAQVGPSIVHSSYIFRGPRLKSLPGSFWALVRVGQDPSDSKSNRFHVDIFRFRFHSFEVILV